MRADRRSSRIPSTGWAAPFVGTWFIVQFQIIAQTTPSLPASQAKHLPNDGLSPYQRLVVFPPSVDKPLWFSDVALLASRFSLSTTGHLPFMLTPHPECQAPNTTAAQRWVGSPAPARCCKHPPSPSARRDPLDIISPGRREEPRIELVAGNHRFQVCMCASLLSIPSSSVPCASLLEHHEGLLTRGSPPGATPPLRRLLRCCVLVPFFPLDERRITLTALALPLSVRQEQVFCRHGC